MTDDTRTREDAVVISWVGPKTTRRMRFEPRDAGGWERITERRDGDGWTSEGTDIVSKLAVKMPD